MVAMKERDVLRLLLARAENYTISEVRHDRGRLYHVQMNGEHYTAVVLVHSYHFYTLRYHISLEKPSLVICFVHDTVCPVPVLSLRSGNFAEAYELPEEITDIQEQRHSRTGAQVLLGMYISGMRLGQRIIHDLPESTRARYLSRARALGKRTKGKPVGLPVKKKPQNEQRNKAAG